MKSFVDKIDSRIHIFQGLRILDISPPNWWKTSKEWALTNYSIMSPELMQITQVKQNQEHLDDPPLTALNFPQRTHKEQTHRKTLGDRNKHQPANLISLYGRHTVSSNQRSKAPSLDFERVTSSQILVLRITIKLEEMTHQSSVKRALPFFLDSIVILYPHALLCIIFWPMIWELRTWANSVRIWYCFCMQILGKLFIAPKFTAISLP